MRRRTGPSDARLAAGTALARGFEAQDPVPEAEVDWWTNTVTVRLPGKFVVVKAEVVQNTVRITYS